MDDDESRCGRRKQKNPRKQNVDEGGGTEQQPQESDTTTSSSQQQPSSSSNHQSESLETGNSNLENGDDDKVTNGDRMEMDKPAVDAENKEEVSSSSSSETPLAELMQRTDTAIIFPEPVETRNNTQNNNNNDSKDSESNASDEKSEKSMTGGVHLLQQCPCCHLVCPTLAALGDHMLALHPGTTSVAQSVPNPVTIPSKTLKSNGTMKQEEGNIMTHSSQPQQQNNNGDIVSLQKSQQQQQQGGIVTPHTLHSSPAQQQGDIVTSTVQGCICPECGATCQDADELEKHLEQRCPVVQECKICQKTFANVYRLQRHMLTHEESTELRKFKCPECAKAFKFKHHLKEHIRIHSGEKPFECNNCGKRFSHSGSYSSHMTSKKCWVGGSGNTHNTPTTKVRSKMAATTVSLDGTMTPPRQSDVLRPLVAKDDENGIGALIGAGQAHPGAAFLYHQHQQQQGQLVDPFLQYNLLAMRPYLLSQYAFHQQLLGATAGKTPVAALPTMPPPLMKNFENQTAMITEAGDAGEEMEKSGSDEKENKEDKNQDSEHSEPEPGEKIKEESMMTTKEKEEETIRKVIEMVEATAKNSQSQSQSQESKVNTSVSSQELEDGMHAGIHQCHYCNAQFNNPIELHQHERYLCVQNHHQGSPSSASICGDNHSDDGGYSGGGSVQGCRVRSILSDEQKRHLEAQYAATPWPAKHDMDRLATNTGLARRVIQVWFQNCRARDRRKGKSIPERPTGIRTPPDVYPQRPVSVSNTTDSNSTPTPIPSRYIPRVPQIQRQFFTPTPAMMTTNAGIQIEPLDLSNKPGQINEQVLNLSTKAPTPPPAMYAYPEEAATPPPAVNTTPAHSHNAQRTTPDRQLIPSMLSPISMSMGSAVSSMSSMIVTSPYAPIVIAPTTPVMTQAAASSGIATATATSGVMPLSLKSGIDPSSSSSSAVVVPTSVTPSPPPTDPRTSTPLLHRSSPAVFPSMISSTPPPLQMSGLAHGLMVGGGESPGLDMESSFGSSGDDKSDIRKRAWRQLEGDDGGAEGGEKRKRKSWKVHKVEQNTGETTGLYTCDQCDKLFSKQSSLARHKYEHSGQRPFPCDVCHKAFKHKHHLTEHKRLHSGEKPFECAKCSKRFSHSGSYSQHMNHRYKYCKPEGGIGAGGDGNDTSMGAVEQQGGSMMSGGGDSNGVGNSLEAPDVGGDSSSPKPPNDSLTPPPNSANTPTPTPTEEGEGSDSEHSRSLSGC